MGIWYNARGMAKTSLHAHSILRFFVWLAGGLNHTTENRLVNPQHALLQLPAGAGVNAIVVRSQRILSSQRRVVCVTSQREQPLWRDG